MLNGKAWRSWPANVCLPTLAVVAAVLPAGAPGQARYGKGPPPNVLLVMTDDHGYGDLACHGNKYIRTPAMDQLYRESVRLTNFHVDPVGAPTRAALLTGRYACRTGVWHTMGGRSLLRRDETTMVEVFAAAEYRTAIFGKWHLGDNYPYRAVDRGFHESLVHGGGNIGQTPDYWGNSYLNPVLIHNGKPQRTAGYCTDVFFDAAIKFIEANRAGPFFVYVAPNVPHSPYHVHPEYHQPYGKMGLQDALAKYYGMITNFDRNMGRLLSKLDQLGLSGNTIVVFLVDNGTSGRRPDATLQGRKGSLYDGGHCVPCFFRWPDKLKVDLDDDHLAAHIDVFPTLLDLCSIRYPEGVKFDGTSLLPLLVGVEDWAPRQIFVQSHRTERPQPWRQSAVMTEKYRLIDGRELYDVKKDPGQLYNIAAERPKIVDQLRFDYEEWYKDVSRRFGEFCPIVLGSAKQNPTQLTCFDWHGPNVPWSQALIAGRSPGGGFWAVEVERAGRYRFTLRERPAAARRPLPRGAARIKIGSVQLTKAIAPGATGVVFEMKLAAGQMRLETWIAEPGGGVRGAYYVEVEYLGAAAGE